MAAFARAVRNPYVTGIAVTVVATFSAAVLGASDVVTIVIGLGALGAVIGSQRLATRNSERNAELTVDRTITRRIDRNKMLQIEAKRPSAEQNKPHLPADTSDHGS